MKIFLLTILLSFVFISCANDENSLLIEPSAQEIEETRLSSSFLECLRGNQCEDEMQISTRNLELRKLINFNDLWESYPGHDYSLEEVKELVGGTINSNWIHNSCTIRLSRALNYSDNNISRWGFQKYAGQWGNPGLVLRGDDNLDYAIRVREMAKYLLKFYGLRPIHLTKSQAVRATLTNRNNLYSDDNIRETEELENALKATGKKGILMFNVALWSDATGHFEVWNGEESKGHSRFLEAQEIFLWVVEDNYEELAQITCPEHSQWEEVAKACTCEEGYKMNNDETECQVLMGVQSNTAVPVETGDNGDWTTDSAQYTYWHINPELGGRFNCRAGAGTNNAILTTLTPSENIDSLKEVAYDYNNNIWFKVVTRDGINCFLRAKSIYIKPSLFTETTNDLGNWKVETSLYKYWKITNQINSMNCRAGAGTNNEVLTTLSSNDYITSLNTYDYDSSNNVWFKFKTQENINCFIRARSRYIEPR